MVTPVHADRGVVGVVVSLRMNSVEVGERAAVIVADGIAVGGKSVSVGTRCGETTAVADWDTASRVGTEIVGEQPASRAARKVNQPAKWKGVILANTAQIIKG
jgi:hypothetical protein